MRYPLNKTATVAAWMSVLDNPGATDEEFAGAVVDLVNTAYYAGVNAGFSRGGGAVMNLPRKMTGALEELKVQRIAPAQLTGDMLFLLCHQFNKDRSGFTALYKNNVLYVNQDIPEEDVRKFVDIATYPGPRLNDPDGPMCPVLDDIFYRYPDAYDVLQDIYRKRIAKVRKELAEAAAAKIFPTISSAFTDDELDGIEDGELVFAVYDIGYHNRGRSNVNTGIRSVFWLGYFIGTGRIRMEEIYEKE